MPNSMIIHKLNEIRFGTMAELDPAKIVINQLITRCADLQAQIDGVDAYNLWVTLANCATVIVLIFMWAAK